MSRTPTLALLGLLLASCSAAPPPLAEPQTLHFTPAHDQLALRLAHAGDEPLPLSRIRIDPRDADWSAFTLTDASLPRRIEPGGEVLLHLRVDVDHFARPGDAHAHRDGAGSLTLLAGGQPQRIALRFSDGARPLAVDLVRFALLLGLAAALILAARARRIPWAIGLPAAVALAIAPLGPGLCWTSPGAALGLADLHQCADGRGGAPLQMLPHTDGLGLLLAVLLLSRLASPGRERISGEVVRSGLALALALLAAVVAGGSFDPQQLAQAQSGLRWGLWMQPFAAAALTIAALAEVRAAGARAPLAGTVAAVGLAALLTTLCLGGGELPLLRTPALPHAAVVAMGLALWLLKVGALAWLLRRAPIPARALLVVVLLAISQLVLSLFGGP